MRAAIKIMPSRDELLRLFAYDPESGKLTWRVRPHPQAKRIVPGMEAGTIRKGRNPYLAVGVDQKFYLAQRIIWKMVTGEDPPDQVDHRDLNRLNNKWKNLRLATNSQNRCNSKLAKNNKSGVKGVCWDAGHKKWVATISINKKHLRVGRFHTISDAAAALGPLREKLHGEFARIR